MRQAWHFSVKWAESSSPILKKATWRQRSACGKVYVNSTGNPGMATAGSGDVLTGVIAGLMAQGYPTDCSVWMGVYVHGLAGDLAARVHGEHGLMAGDIADAVGPAIGDLLSDVSRR